MNTIKQKIYFENFEAIKNENNDERLCFVKNIVTDEICIQKIVSLCQKEIYDYLLKNHIPNTPKIYDMIVCDNFIVILCEYIDGMTLTDYLNNIYVKNINFNAKTFYKQINTLCDIINNLQKTKIIIHRDIKPGNILIDKNDNLYLIDFDSAKIYNPSDSEDTHKIGTEKYAAPEQYGFGASNKSTDIFAIGKIISDYTSVVEDDNLNKKISPIIEKCCKIDYRDRYKNISILKTDLFKSEHNLMFLTLPGFRTNNLLHMVIATTIYVLLIYCCFIDTNIYDFNLNLTAFISILLFIFIYFDYLNIQRILPTTKSKNPFVKIISKLFISLIIPTIIIILYIFL